MSNLFYTVHDPESELYRIHSIPAGPTDETAPSFDIAHERCARMNARLDEQRAAVAEATRLAGEISSLLASAADGPLPRFDDLVTIAEGAATLAAELRETDDALR